MNVWILAGEKSTAVHSRKRWIEEAEKMGIKIKIVIPEDFEIIEPAKGSETVIYKKKPTPLPDCVIPRMGSKTTYFALSVLRLFESLGVFVLNSSMSIEKSKDKFRATQILAENNLPIPKTMLTKFPLDMRRIKKELGFPLVLKIRSGSQGKGVVLCEKEEQLEDILALSEEGSMEKMNLVLQEFISHTKGKDVRIFVVGGKPLGAMLRAAKPGQFKANFSMGGSVQKVELTDEMTWLATESARIMGLNVAGVDILLDKEGYRICEINSSPGFKGFEMATEVNVAREILDFIKLKIQQ